LRHFSTEVSPEELFARELQRRIQHAKAEAAVAQKQSQLNQQPRAELLSAAAQSAHQRRPTEQGSSSDDGVSTALLALAAASVLGIYCGTRRSPGEVYSRVFGESQQDSRARDHKPATDGTQNQQTGDRGLDSVAARVSSGKSIQEWMLALERVLLDRALDAVEQPYTHPDTLRAALLELGNRRVLLQAELTALKAMGAQSMLYQQRMEDVQEDLHAVEMATNVLKTALEEQSRGLARH
jgi:hypothetical protein